ncbi:hypothetical protein BG006_001946 [Podila minutissima]|uniref:Uncharacterized protein n=1 Tax=Podila minutissima TaxID=64525 RepID=A0A9P5VGV6_9FUNG|nr:hypothetical protein BG006_001946 [Podila minutissima]
MPLRSDKVPLSELKYFTHDFANQGVGHKFSELLMGLHFAKKNRLHYVFNEKSFVHNFRQADLQWLGGLIQQQYPVPQEVEPNGQVFEMNLKQWIPVYYYQGSTADAYAQMNELELRRPLLGFGGRNAYYCPGGNPRPDSSCFLAEFSFFNATRDIQDLLQASELTVQGQHKVEQVERLAIHIRLGDITISEQPETYVKIGDNGAQALAAALRTNSTLTILNLDQNLIGDSGAQALAAALRTNSTLTSLDLRSIEIGFRGVQALSAALRTNSTLASLDLRANRIGDKKAQVLFEALKTNSTLTTVNLDQNSTGDSGAQAVSEALKMNSTLTTLNLDQNSIGGDGVQALAETLKTNSTLTTLELWSNNIGDSGAQVLSEALKSNSTLTTLELWSNKIG